VKGVLHEMNTRLRNRMALVVCSFLTIVTGLATGLALGCTGNYCHGSVNGCTRLYDSTYDNCCQDLDQDGMKHCVTCWRDWYLCSSGPALGPAYNCTSAGVFCS
jgi:hypothetical protein